ncbi:sensor histidine kinase [Paenibacillus eucommiae]|uniref:histidine kinase n=1 Tax=Paenibacillus eucommiae TaxID=1355755 RepID=A0ABS4IT01_9BACL|nr:histidine kinase [Paenibacillus eucommiae]MBP1989729.1 two-component system nitrate/nitrite sensor histidine kinase NarQ [Paenibacillus eucommiae]
MILYKNIKSLILIIPTLTIGLWEYLRHTILLPYISMELGNWLSPLIIFLVTMTLLRQLFQIMEHLQEQLQQEKAAKASLEEREKIARELHDGIAQSLFLLSVKVDRLEKDDSGERSERTEPYQSFRKTVHQINEYVRQAIANLRYPPIPAAMPWKESIHNLVQDFKKDTGITAELDWQLSEDKLSMKEKVELYATLREALINVYKHANASQAWVSGQEDKSGWRCMVKDNGKGFLQDGWSSSGSLDSSGNSDRLDSSGSSSDSDRLDSLHASNSSTGYGLRIMKERALELGWFLDFKKEQGLTIIEVGKRGEREG